MVCEGCVNNSLFVLTTAKDLGVSPADLPPTGLTDYAESTTLIGSLLDVSCLFLLARMKSWIRSTLAFWKRNGLQLSDYKRRFVWCFPPQRILVGIVSIFDSAANMLQITFLNIDSLPGAAI